MEFRTQYSERKPVFSNGGSPVHTQYGGHYDEKGRVVLEEVGKINLYEEIQSHAESVDIHAIMRRFANGDTDALSKRQGFFGDVTQFPSTYAEVLNHMQDMEAQFKQLSPEIRERFGNSFTEFLAGSNQPDFLQRLGVEIPKEDPKVSPAIPVEKKEVSE